MNTKRDFPEWVLWGVVLVWGASYVVGKWGMDGFDPLTFNVIRFVGVTPMLFLLLYALEKNIRIELKDCWEFALLGLIGIAIYQTLFMAAVKYATATNASLMLAVSPVFTSYFCLASGTRTIRFLGETGKRLIHIRSSLGLAFWNQQIGRRLGRDSWRSYWNFGLECMGPISGAR